MTAPEDELHSALAHLESELERAGSLDADARARIAQALHEMRAAVEREDAASRAREASEGEGLLDLVERFAESHPALSASLGRVVDILAKMGI